MNTPRSLEIIPKYQGPSSWWQHVPMAHLLIETLKPKIVVELGSHYGVSFFSFCEAAKRYSPETYVYAIDTWGGDIQAGYYGDEVYDIVKVHRDANYRQNSELIRCMFDDAVHLFDNKSIDLLHIDGLHTYDAVKNDFEVWKPKLKDGGTILFHDWNVRKEGFGVGRLWEQVKVDTRFKCLEVQYGYGLGIATLAEKTPTWHDEIMEYLPTLRAKGLLLEVISDLTSEVESLQNKNYIQEEHIRNLEFMNSERRKEIKDAEKRIREIANRSFYTRVRKLCSKF